MSSAPASMGTSFATGLPRLVMITVSRLAWTSSITARQFVLNTPAAIFFIGAPSTSMVIVPWSYRVCHPDCGAIRKDDLAREDTSLQRSCGRPPARRLTGAWCRVGCRPLRQREQAESLIYRGGYETF